MSCITPFIVKHKCTNKSVPVPCGKCPECKKRRVSGWSFRLMQEEKRCTTAFFLTLTYDTKYVPITKNGFMSVSKIDLQKFMKRLRKDVSKINPLITVKYYAAAEYGGKTQRPHYHIIMFNVPDPYLIEQNWQLGTIHYGKVEGASVGYTLKYLDKQKRIPAHRNDDRLPEFGIMSKGLGENYLTDSIRRYHKADLLNRMCLTIENGKKVAMPRYYKLKLYTEEERKRIAFFSQIDNHKRQEEIEKLYGPNYSADMATSDLNKFRKLELSSKKRDKL